VNSSAALKVDLVLLPAYCHGKDKDVDTSFRVGGGGFVITARKVRKRFLPYCISIFLFVFGYATITRLRTTRILSKIQQSVYTLAWLT
jgi:hypothetical protein